METKTNLQTILSDLFQKESAKTLLISNYDESKVRTGYYTLLVTAAYVELVNTLPNHVSRIEYHVDDNVFFVNNNKVANFGVEFQKKLKRIMTDVESNKAVVIRK